MARTFKVVGNKLEITETQPPLVRTIDIQQLTRQINKLNAEIEEVEGKITALENKKTKIEAVVAELTPYVGQL